MRVAVLEHAAGLSAYLGEILDAWGLCGWSFAEPGQVAGLDPAEAPVLVVPAGAGGERRVEQAVLAYVQAGGTAVAMLPQGDVARAAGIEQTSDKEPPLRLRLAGPPMAGLAGESLPVVGTAQTWSLPAGAEVLAFLHHPERYEGESAGIVRAAVGAGAVVALAFDLVRAVLLLRQGDPAHREETGRGDANPARPAQLACDLGPGAPGWIPFADLLGLLLVDLVEAAVPAPLPRLWHLPGGAAGILLYSGDEDGAEVEWNRTEFEAVTAAGGRMNLFVIPINTHSTREDVAAYRRHHDVGPHPNIRRLDGEPVTARVAEMERQIRQFEEMYGVKARSLRHHCIAWAGYLEPVEAMARCGVGMDGNYFCSSFLRGRECAPYATFGAALPLRFCHPGGDLLPVHQQHTHTMDDVYFGPESVVYSFRLSPPQWEAVIDRVYDDVVRRFHVPHAVCIHPSNWVRFSEAQGRALLNRAGERALPIWSFDQWLSFWQARQEWRCATAAWDGSTLRLELAGEEAVDGLHLAVPEVWRGRGLEEVTVDGEVVAGDAARRHGRPVRLVGLGSGTEGTVTVRYGDEGRR